MLFLYKEKIWYKEKIQYFGMVLLAQTLTAKRKGQSSWTVLDYFCVIFGSV